MESGNNFDIEHGKGKFYETLSDVENRFVDLHGVIFPQLQKLQDF
jgi:hypothetical protein